MACFKRADQSETNRDRDKAGPIMYQDYYYYFFSHLTLLIVFTGIFPNFKHPLDGTKKVLKCNYAYYARYKTLLSLNIVLQTDVKPQILFMFISRTDGETALCVSTVMFSPYVWELGHVRL